MSQAFEPQTELFVKLVLSAILGLFVLAVVLLVSCGQTTEPRAGVVVAQPIPFSHKHHVGDVGLDCRFCHVTVETRAQPGLPSAQLCLTCHSQLFSDQSLLAPLRQSVASGQPIAWQHLNRLPDYVFFDHSVHIAKNVACVECHGRVDQMPLMARAAPLTMRWCIECHSAPGQHLVQPGQQFSMTPRRLDDADVASLERLLSLESKRRMTDCSTCHR